MNRGIYSLASGMVATQQAMNVLSNNLANVNTDGFKKDHVAFNDALQQALTGSDGTALGSLGSGGTIKEQYTDLTQGPLRSTSNPLDVAIQGKGMFAVQAPNGQIMYTRAGSFTTDANGNLTTQQGYPVLDNNQKPVQLRPGTMSLGADGSISTGEDGPVYAQLGVFDGTFTKTDSGLYAAANATALQGAGLKLKQGMVEGSNVSPITSMVDMISLSRSYDAAQKSIQSEDDMSQRLTSVLS
jgi:flagellar basal-body rod protein FlgG